MQNPFNKSQLEFIDLITEIVKNAKALKDKYTEEKDAPVNYVCIFCQSEKEFDFLQKTALSLGDILDQTYSGPLILLHTPIKTVSGNVRIIKIRKPDPQRPCRGDADFTVKNFEEFKKQVLDKKYFSLIKRPKFEMIELYVPGENVRVYFSNPTLEEIYLGEA